MDFSVDELDEIMARRRLQQGNLITVQLNGSVIGADPAKLGEELARLVDGSLSRIAARECPWRDTHAWYDAWPRA